MKPQRLRRFLVTVAVVVADLVIGSSGLDAQLVLENPGGGPQPGEVVELTVPSPDQGLEIHAVRLGDRSIPFDLVAPGGDRPLRIRIRLPEDLEPGDHRISALFAETRVRVPEVRGLTLEEARRKLEASRLEADPASMAEAAGGVSGKILQQAPGAGATVPAGTRVSLAFAAPSLPVWLLPALAAAVLLSVATGLQVRRRRRRRKKDPKKVRVTANQHLTALHASVKVTTRDGGSQPGARPAAEPGQGPQIGMAESAAAGETESATATEGEDEDEADNFTIGSLFFPQDDEEAMEEEGEGLESLEQSLEEEAPDTPFKAVKAQVTAKIGEALEIGLEELLGPAWEKLEIFREYLDPEDPDEPIPVPLVGHAIETSHTPSVEVTVKGVKLATIELAIDLELALDGLVLELLGEKIVTLRAGTCVVSGSLAGSLVVKGVSTDLMSFEKESPEIRLRGLDLAIVIPNLRERLGR